MAKLILIALLASLSCDAQMRACGEMCGVGQTASYAGGCSPTCTCVSSNGPRPIDAAVR